MAALATALVTVVVIARPAEAGTVQVTTAGLVFSPATASVQMTAGEPALPEPHGHVRWTNADPVTEHTVTFEDRRLASSGRLATGQTHEVVFAMTGTFAYRCTIHPTMTGTVVVTDPPPPTTVAAAATPDPEPRAEPGLGAAPLVTGAAVLAGAAVLVWLLVRRRRGRAGPSARR